MGEKIYVPAYRWKDKHGNPVRHGYYVHYVRGESSPDNGPTETDGWVLQEYVPDEDDFCLRLYTNDAENHLHFTGIYWVFDGEPLYDLKIA